VRVWVVQELYVQNESIIVNLCDENKRQGESIHRKGETEKKRDDETTVLMLEDRGNRRWRSVWLRGS